MVPKLGYENHPVVFVTWYGARAFAHWIGGDLPTEAQWEYAARSGGRTGRKFPWGDEFDGEKVNFADRNTNYGWSSTEWDDGYVDTAPVGSYISNDLGLHDMAGNVYEWCYDWYGEYRGNAQSDPAGSYRGDQPVLRGGSFYDLVGAPSLFVSQLEQYVRQGHRHRFPSRPLPIELLSLWNLNFLDSESERNEYLENFLKKSLSFRNPNGSFLI